MESPSCTSSNSNVVADDQWRWQGDEQEVVPGQVTDKVRWPLVSSALCLLSNAFVSFYYVSTCYRALSHGDPSLSTVGVQLRDVRHC
jgi:hypothetical protein